MEVEEMISKVREQQGRSFDVRDLISSCIGNVMMSMLFGHRFSLSDTDFQQLLSDNNDGGTNFSMAVELFPVLRFLPYFKKLIADELRLVKSVLNFIDNNVAGCLKVCNGSLNTVSLYYFIKYVWLWRTVQCITVSTIQFKSSSTSDIGLTRKPCCHKDDRTIK